MTTTGTTPPPTPVPGEVKPRRALPRREGGEAPGAGRANWLVKVALVVLCFLWIVPTLGIVVTAFRTADACSQSIPKYFRYVASRNRSRLPSSRYLLFSMHQYSMSSSPGFIRIHVRMFVMGLV